MRKRVHDFVITYKWNLFGVFMLMLCIPLFFATYHP